MRYLGPFCLWSMAVEKCRSRCHLDHNELLRCRMTEFSRKPNEVQWYVFDGRPAEGVFLFGRIEEQRQQQRIIFFAFCESLLFAQKEVSKSRCTGCSTQLSIVSAKARRHRNAAFCSISAIRTGGAEDPSPPNPPAIPVAITQKKQESKTECKEGSCRDVMVSRLAMAVKMSQKGLRPTPPVDFANRHAKATTPH